jgi:hypothetical protein
MARRILPTSYRVDKCQHRLGRTAQQMIAAGVSDWLDSARLGLLPISPFVASSYSESELRGRVLVSILSLSYPELMSGFHLGL